MGQISPYLATIVLIVFSISGTKSYRQIGCFKENSIVARLMVGDQKDFKGTLTPEKCVTYCKNQGFSFAGLQYAYECFCSKERPSYKYSANSEECNMKCEGDRNKICGGGLRLSVYDIHDKRVNYVQPNYVGCYSDDGESRRALRDKSAAPSDDMTPELCVGYCYRHGYRYAGLQYRNQCFCGDSVKGERTSEGDCDMDCAGDPRFICGGGWRNSVYHTSISDEGEDGRLVGCYQDSESLRLLSGYTIILSETNSPRRCMNICLQLGFKFAGVENGNECYCGNKRPSSEKEAPENECLASCPRTGVRRCGGQWRLFVYSTSPAPITVAVPGQGPAIIAVPLGNQVTTLLSNAGTGGGNTLVTSQGQILTSGIQQPQQPVYPQQPTSRPQEPTSRPQEPVYHQQPTARPQQPVYHQEPTYQQPHGEYQPNPPRNTQRTTTERSRTSTATPQRWPPTGTSSLCPRSRTEHAGKAICEGELIFHEKFNNWTPGIWKHEIFMPDAPDYEFVVFDDNRDNIYIQNGNLHIKPSLFEDNYIRQGTMTLEKCTARMFSELCQREGRGFQLLPPVRSARITTKESFSFKYGKVQVKARLPVGDWVIPEIWLEPKERVYGPGYESGRIRIAVSLGNKELTYNGEDIGSRRLEAGVLMGTGEKVRGRKIIKPNRRNRGWYEDFHNYTLIWTPDNISFQVDNEEIENLIPTNAGKLYQLVGFDRNSASHWGQGTPIAPFDQEFYISLGVSVGGMREFPDNCISGRHVKPWKNLAVKGLLNFWDDREFWMGSWNDPKFGLVVADVTVNAL